MLLRLLPDEYQRRTASQTGVSELTDAVVDEDDYRYRECKGGDGDTYAHAAMNLCLRCDRANAWALRSALVPLRANSASGVTSARRARGCPDTAG
jgi:hypothetical protein